MDNKAAGETSDKAQRKDSKDAKEDKAASKSKVLFLYLLPQSPAFRGISSTVQALLSVLCSF